MNPRRTFMGFLVFVFAFMSLASSPDVSFANAHPNARISDGNATQEIGKGYDPRDVNSDIKKRFEKGNMSGFVKGDKYPRTKEKGSKIQIYNPSLGNKLAYDVFTGKTNNRYKQGLRKEKHNGEDFLVFDGWAVNEGYYHHGRHNQVTYIGVENTNTGERKIYKAQMTNLDASRDIHWYFGPKDKICPNSGKNAHMKYSSECNMKYRWVGFRAYIPLEDLFPNTKQGSSNEWRLWIIKGVKGYGYTPSQTISGARYLYAPLIIPFDTEKIPWTWNGKNANVVVTSGTETRTMTMTTQRVFRRTEPHPSNKPLGKYFKEHKRYPWVVQHEDSSVTPWHGVRSSEDGGRTRYATSTYWQFGGQKAVIKLEQLEYDVTVKHLDKLTGEVLLDEGKKVYKRGKRTFKPKEKGYFVTPEGYPYVPLDKEKEVNINKNDIEVEFHYKASIPDPSRIVEQSGGQNTHGHAVGQAEWKLAKDDKPVEIPDPNEKDYKYRTVTGGVEIIDYVGKNTNIKIPEKLGGKTVVSIADEAFASKGLTSVIIPDTVVKIGKGAFKFNDLTTINIPDGVGEIEDEAFRNNRIEHVTLPDAVQSVGKYAFFGNLIKEVEFGSSLELIDESAFANNQIGHLDFSKTNLKYIKAYAFLNNNDISSVIFNEGLAEIGDYAFAGNALTEVVLPKSLIEVGAFSFASNFISDAVVNNERMKFGQGVFASNKENPRDLTIYGYIPSTAKDYADENNHSFKDLYDEYVYIEVEDGVEIVKYNGQDEEIRIPRRLGGKDVVSIGAYAFAEHALRSVELPSTVHTIKESAFAKNELTEIDLRHVKRIGNGAFSYNKLTNVLFGIDLEEIGIKAFDNNELTSVRIPLKVTVIEENAFADNNIESVLFHNNITDIKDGAFINNKLTSLELPNKLKTIGAMAFYNNEIENVKIPLSLERIGDSAFENNNLSEVKIRNVNLEFGDSVFSGNKMDPEDFKIIAYCGSTANEYAVVYGHTFESLDGKECNSYILVNDEDFEFVEVPEGPQTHNDVQGYFRYVGGAEYVEIPEVIHGTPVTSYYRMFENSNVKGVKSTNKNVKDMRKMFYNSQAEKLDVSLLNTENVTAMGAMFFGSKATEIIGLDNFNTSNVTDMSYMFASSSLPEFDLSSFDTSNVTDMSNMFSDSKATTGYARTQADADKFNASSGKPPHLIFVVKQDGDYVVIPEKDLDWEIINGNEVKITNYKGNDKYIIIPDEIDGKKVTEIGRGSATKGYGAFVGKGLKGVIFNPSLKKIEGTNAPPISSHFALNELTEITFPETLEYLGRAVFFGNKLKKVTVLNPNMMFDDYALDRSGDDITIYGYVPSTAKTFAEKHGYDFVEINEITAMNTANQNKVVEKEVELKNDTLLDKIKNFFAGNKVNADATLKESKTQLLNNFIVTGNHAGVRNVKHTIKVGNHVETDEKPFSIIVDPADTKNKDMEYDFEYEYTNHVEMKYKCTDKKGNDCFAWKLDKVEPVWKAPYVKKFKLSDTAGEFERYSTNRLGRINHANALIYSSLDDNEPKRAGNDLLGRTFYIKEKAVKGNDVRYLISTHASNTEGVIGWVSELDMTTYTHYQMDRKTKTFKLTGKGKAYNMIWGGNQQEAGIDLSKQKDKEFVVNMTETVGDDIWYRGKIDGKGNNVWIHKNHTTSNEIIKINEVPETPLNNVNNNFAKLTLKMDHKHGEELKFTKNTDNKAELLVGRNARHDESGITTSTFKETIEVDRKDTKLETQTWKEIKHTFKYESDLGNPFHVIEGDKYYYPYDLDENLREKYRNNTEHDYGKYAIPLRVSDEKHDELEFKSADNFFITKKTGFQFSLPHHEVSTVVIKEQAKEQYEAFTGNKYDKDDTVISDPFDASRYYLNIALDGEQKPNTKYSDNVVLGRLGLSDVTVHLIQDLEFERYLVGHYKDDPVMVEQKTSVIKGIEYTNEVTLTPEQIKELKRIQKEREGVIHSFRKTDDAEIIEKVKGVTP